MSATVSNAGPHVEDTHPCAEEFDVLMLATIKRIYGNMRGAAKRLAWDANTSHRTAEGWLSGRSRPGGANLVYLLAECDELNAEMQKLLKAVKATRKR